MVVVWRPPPPPKREAPMDPSDLFFLILQMDNIFKVRQIHLSAGRTHPPMVKGNIFGRRHTFKLQKLSPVGREVDLLLLKIL